MNILIRCDASLEIGSGHTVRCFALATELQKRGHRVTFAALPLPGNFNSWLRDRGCTIVEPAEKSWSLEWIPPAPMGKYDVCIVDHYSLDQNYEQKLRSIAERIVSVDDWGARTHAADLMIDPSYSESSEDRRRSNPGIPFYTGPEWTILREDFAEAHLHTHPRQQFKKVMVFFGGTDPADQTLPYYRFISEQKTSLEFHFLIGAQNPRIEEFRKLTPPAFIRFDYAPPRISEYMKDMDLYLGSSGTISWERMCMGLTGLIVSIVDNQESIARTLHDEGLHLYLGKHTEVSPEHAFHQLQELMKDPSRIENMSQRSYALVDGRGAQRVVDLIEKIT